MKFRSSISVVAVITALMAGPAAAANGEYVVGETNFPPSASMVEEKFIPGVTDFPRTGPTTESRYIPGVTDFPRTGPTVPITDSTPIATDDGIQWGDATVVGAALALALAIIGSSLLMRRRSTLAHS